jgi:hypothetical protein
VAAHARRRALAAARLPVLRGATAVALALQSLLGPVAPSAAAAGERGRAEASARQARPADRPAEASRSRARAQPTARASTRPARRPAARATRQEPVLPRLDPAVLGAVRTASGGREPDGVLLLALAWRESRFDPRADNPASSARGLMQFTRDTWLETIRDHGGATGAVSVADPRRLAEILALRDDPRLSAVLAMARIERARARLAAMLGRPVGNVDLYLVHFLGQAGAERFLRQLARTPSHRATPHVGPEVVAANRSVFVTRQGRHRSLEEVHAGIRTSLEAQRHAYAAMLRRRGDAIEVASAE